MSALKHLGKGWSFPVVTTSDGSIPVAEGPDKVVQSIRIILDTEPGERLMRPSFGCGLRRYLMSPNTSATRTLIKGDVQVALDSFEPRITVSSISVEPGDDPALVMIEISYVHVRNGQRGNLVYPFFLQA